MNIPKIAHVSWVDKDVIDKQSQLILNGVRNLIDLNPDWNVVMYDNNDIDEYLKSVLDKRDYNLIKVGISFFLMFSFWKVATKSTSKLE